MYSSADDGWRTDAASPVDFRRRESFKGARDIVQALYQPTLVLECRSDVVTERPPENVLASPLTVTVDPFLRRGHLNCPSHVVPFLFAHVVSVKVVDLNFHKRAISLILCPYFYHS